MVDEGKTFITLRCIDCENPTCDISRKYVFQNSKEGCTREVSEEVAARYYHYMEEVVPF